MHSMLKTTTALLASLSLLLPTATMAQTPDNAIECPDDLQVLCDAVTGERIGGTDEEPTEDGASEDGESTEAESGESDADAEAEAAAEAEPEAEAAAQAAAEAAAEAQAAEEQAAEDAQASEAAEEQAAEDARAAEEQAAEEAEAAEEQAAEDAEATQEQATEDAQDAEEQSMEEAEAAEERAAKDARTAEEAEEQAVEEAREAAEQAVEGTAEAEAEADPAPAEDTATGEAGDDSESPANAAAAAIAAIAAGALNSDAEPVGEVESETVTEETARSSSEDFDGTINTTAEAQAESDDDDGLSNFEKALLVGAGALAVGAIIRGNREVVSTAEDRVVVSRDDGSFEVIKDDNALLRRPGSTIDTQTFADGSTLTTTTREDGSQVITIRDAELRVVRRSLVRPDGTEVALIDDTQQAEPVDVSTLPEPAPAVRAADTEEALRTALMEQRSFDRRFSLSQVRQITEVRELAPVIAVDTINFATGSSAIRPEQAESLARLGLTISRMIGENPQEVFLVEGHTDATGPASNNLLLSDRRAESLALALTEYFDVPPENLVVQGYGESDLLIQTEAAEERNRRAGLRRITPLLQTSQLD